MKQLQSAVICCVGTGIVMVSCHREEPQKRPNILIAVSDDQSFAHTSFAGCRFINTPAFDRVAGSGIYFKNCWSGSPGSAPSRSSLVTGRYHWQNESSGQHASAWLAKYVPFPDELSRAGYHTGFTGKGVGPFQYARNEEDSLWRKGDAAGKPFNRIRYGGEHSDERTAGGISPIDYYANFTEFMKQRKGQEPFFFWYGANEPHRNFEKGSWQRNGKQLESVEVPGFLPDDPEIRGDILDYAVEIEWFDRHLGKMLNYLDSTGELDNTVVVVTGDNGMAFPGAKAFFYEYGIHVPLAISYPGGFPGNRVVEDPVSFTDLAPTILELTGTKPELMQPMSGRSILNILKSRKAGVVDKTKKYIFAGRERHSSSRWNNLGYPVRAIRSREYMLVWNIKPDLWPAGDPQALIEGSYEPVPMYGIDENGRHQSDWAFTDVDASPSKSFIIEHNQDPGVRKYFDFAFSKHPDYELYDVIKDPCCLVNLSGNKDYARVEQEMRKALFDELERSGDPRVTGPDRDIFESYPRFSPMRRFPPHVTEPSLPEAPAGDSFFEAALSGAEEEVLKQLGEGTDINLRDGDGRTVLMYASFNGHAGLIKELLDRGAWVDIRDVNGRTALMLASSGPFPEAVRLLLEHGADPNLYDKAEHFTAIMFAAAEGHLEVVKLLLKNHADPSLKDVDGDNALTFANNNGHKEVAGLLGSYK